MKSFSSENPKSLAWRTAPREDALLGSSERRPPWRNAPREDALRGSSERRLPWRTALITGASSGIGEALARELARQGVFVILAARRVQLCKKIAREISDAGGRAVAVRMDVARAEKTVKQIQMLDRQHGGIDLVVANAGVGVRTDAHRVQRTPRTSVSSGVRTDAHRVQRTPRTSVSSGMRRVALSAQRAPRTSKSLGERGGDHLPSYGWQAVRAVAQINYTGALATITALLPVMVQRGRGQVVAISSLAGFTALPDAAGYSSPKAGLSRFMECLALDLQNTGVVVSTVHVGFVRTAMVAQSTFPLPFLISTESAARYMVQKMARKKREINFPLPMVIFVRLMAALPFFVKKFLARKFSPAR